LFRNIFDDEKVLAVEPARRAIVEDDPKNV